ncbi:hypothetical protein HDU82_003527 [Entophlyctis luteolus]|nr:hypothetical protein HDU82_003527 [Entophlyctis luteolus]
MIHTPAASKRTAQKREASRAFRERRANYIRELEEKARSAEATTASGDKDSEIKALKSRIAALESENVLLRHTSIASFNAPSFDFPSASSLPSSANYAFVMSLAAPALVDSLVSPVNDSSLLGAGDPGAQNQPTSALPSLPLFGLLPQLSSPSTSPPSHSTSADAQKTPTALEAAASFMSFLDSEALLLTPTTNTVDTAQLISEINAFHNPAGLAVKPLEILPTAEDRLQTKTEMLSATAEDFSLEAWLFSEDDAADPPIKKEDACRIVAGTVVSLKNSLKPEVVDELCTLITNKCGCRDN